MITTPLGEIHEHDQQEARLLCDQLGISSSDTELVDYVAYGLHCLEARDELHGKQEPNQT